MLILRSLKNVEATVKVATATAMLYLLVPVSAAAEPKVLSDFELESVSSAGVVVDVASYAGARGDVTNTHTDADTIVSGNGLMEVGVGLTVGQAIACCRERGASVDVVSVVSGDGDYVYKIDVARKSDDDDSWIVGYSIGFILAISFPDVATVQQRMLDGALATMVQGLQQQIDASPHW
jgi:hypothetical protein